MRSNPLRERVSCAVKPLKISKSRGRGQFLAGMARAVFSVPLHVGPHLTLPRQPFNTSAAIAWGPSESLPSVSDLALERPNSPLRTRATSVHLPLTAIHLRIGCSQRCAICRLFSSANMVQLRDTACHVIITSLEPPNPQSSLPLRP